jgi:DNA-binding transcriptional LysR family regulator
MLTLKMLKTFRLVVSSGSFAAAAEKAALTQAAVSHQMRGLEEALKRDLFDRSARQILLTRQGHEIAPKIDQILDLVGELAAQPLNAMQGPVTIGAVVSAIQALSVVVANLKTKYPQLDVRLTSARSDELTAMVQEGEVDLAAVVGRADHKATDGLSWVPLYSEPLMLVVGRDITDTDPKRILLAHHFLRFDRRERTGHLVDQVLKALDLNVNEYLELNSTETILALVRQNLGVAVLPRLHRGNLQADPALRLIPLGAVPFMRTVGLIHRSSYQHKGLMEAIVDMMHAT